MIERYTPISRFLYEDEYLFHDLDQSGSGFEFLFLMAGIIIAAGMLTAVVLGYKRGVAAGCPTLAGTTIATTDDTECEIPASDVSGPECVWL